MIQHSKSMQNDARKRNFKQKTLMLSISTTFSGVISHAGLFSLASCETLGRCSRNPDWKSVEHTVHSMQMSYTSSITSLCV